MAFAVRPRQERSGGCVKCCMTPVRCMPLMSIIIPRSQSGGLRSMLPSMASCPKVAVNPATNPEVSLNHPDMMGHLRYFNPRQDGNWYFDFGPENLLEFRGIDFHITPDTYILCSDHDELLGDNRAACRALVPPERYRETSQIGHRMDPSLTEPGTGDLWQLLQPLL